MRPIQLNPVRLGLAGVLSLGLGLGLAACGKSSTTPGPQGAAATSAPAGSSGSAATSAPAGSSATSSPDSASAAGAMTITIKDFKFGPDPLKAKVGDTITVKNSDNTTHTVTADDHSAFDTGNIDGGGTKTITLTKAGTVPYHCMIHDFMKGVIQVSA